MKKGSIIYMTNYLNRKNKNILILGNAESMWVKEFIEFVLLGKTDQEIYVLAKNSGGEFAEFYKNNSVNLLQTDNPVKLIKNKKLTTVINILHEVRRIKKFDVIHIHYLPLNMMSFIYSKFVLKYGNTVITSFWGSDLLQNDKPNKWQKKCLEKSNYITISGSILKEELVKKYGNVFLDKLRVIKFGISVFPYIDKQKEKFDKKKLKKMLGVNEEKTLVAIGYNARESQQHLEVVEQLKSLPKQYKERISFIFQFGTGVSTQEYRDALKRVLDESGIEYVFTKGFLDKEQTAILRAAADIFVHAQKTDALSASVQEYLYAGAYVVNPVWIDYKELKEVGVQYIEYDSFDKLPHIIQDIVDEKMSNIGIHNTQILKNFASWDAQKRKWLELYN